MTSALIIGGGPAGCSAALGLLRQGFEVTILEQRTQWKNRVCGSFLNPEAVRHLHWLGLSEEIQKENPAKVKSCWITTNFGPSSKIEIDRLGTPGLALPRQTFETLLLKKVQGAGGKVFMGTKALSFNHHNKRWKVGIQSLNEMGGSCHWLEGDLVVFADGRFSRAHSAPHRDKKGWFGWNAQFKGVPQSPGDLSIHFYPKGYVGLLTFKDGSTNASGLIYKEENSSMAWDDILKEALNKNRTLRRLLENSQRISSWAGVGPLPHTPTMRRIKRALTAGDASTVGDPFLGEGIGRALATGPLIHAVGFKPSSKDFGLEPLIQAYNQRFMGAYRSRFQFGLLARFLIKSPWAFKPGLGLLVGARPLTQWITNQFHGGFVSPN